MTSQNRIDQNNATRSVIFFIERVRICCPSSSRTKMAFYLN